MSTFISRRPAFTIVEMLVVIAIISVLVGLLVPALSGVKKRGAKSTEINSLRQVGYAWQMYGTNNNDAALPGLLDIAVQAPRVQGVSRGWGVKYNYPTPPVGSIDKAIPPAPSYAAGQPNIAGPWPWRLLSYLDYSHAIVHGYVDETDESIFELVAEAEEIANAPSFGYNGLYIGGHWQMGNDGGVLTPFYKYYDHCIEGSEVRLSIPTGISQISRSSEMITFCSATSSEHLEPGLPSYQYQKLRPDLEGSHLVAPPFVGNVAQWQPNPRDPAGGLEVLATGTGTAHVHVPLGRFTGAPAVLWADGHCDSQALNVLFDQRKWINNAPQKTSKHIVCPP